MQVLLLIILTTEMLTWDLAVSELTDQLFTGSNGWEYGIGVPSQYYTCDISNYDIMKINNQHTTSTKMVQLKPHYNLTILIELYMGSDSDSNTIYADVLLDGNTILLIDDGILNEQMEVCDSAEISQYYKSEQVMINQEHNDLSFTLQFQTQSNGMSSQNDYKVGFRKIFIFIEPCHPECKYCLGPEVNQCTLCWNSGPQPEGYCNTRCPKYLDYHQGCVSACPRNSMKDTEFSWLCIQSKNITSFADYFNVSPLSIAEWVVIEDPHLNKIIPNPIVFTNSSIEYIGPFEGNEGIQLNTILPSSTIRIRLRAKLITTTDNNLLKIYINNKIVSAMMMFSNYQDEQYIEILEESTINLGTFDVKLQWIEIQAEIDIQNVNIRIQGSYSQNTTVQYWGIRELTIDVQSCQPNCQTCLDKQKCQICKPTFYLHKHTCIIRCPEYSTLQGSNCVDYDEVIQGSSYIAKEYYDSKLLDDILDVQNQPEVNPLNSQTYFYSYYQHRRIFGGPNIWVDGEVIAPYATIQPHYEVRVMLKIMLGDGFAGVFVVTIGPFTRQFHYVNGIQRQMMGRITNDVEFQFDEIIQHTEPSLQISLDCQASTTNPQLSFCAVYDIFILTHQCSPYCQECDSYNSCQNQPPYPSNVLSLTPIICQPGNYYDSTMFECVECYITMNSCISCTNSYDCLECDYGYVFYEQRCQCPYDQVETEGCSVCSSLCNKCLWNSDTCMDCYDSQHRYLSNFECICDYGYYEDGGGNCLKCYPLCHRCYDGLNGNCDECIVDDGVDIINNGYCYCLDNHEYYEDVGKCLLKCGVGEQLDISLNICNSICGDGIIGGNEECDDGNTIAYDGCYNCRLECQQQCEVCNLGQQCTRCNPLYRLVGSICVSCPPGYFVDTLTNDCQPQCGDKLVVGTEECDDGNTIPNDGCYNCRYSCSLHCQLCNFGNCQQCDAGYILIPLKLQCQILALCQPGYYRNEQTNQCDTRCGDKIVAGQEQCDDGNLIQYDGCHECMYQCVQTCVKCSLGVCIECAYGYSVINGQCKIICGDGQIKSPEECDDGNNISRDGCSNCLIDNNYLCTQNSSLQSICFECPINCDQCQLILDQPTCTQCKSGYYQSQSQCRQCGSKCKECSGSSNQCTLCHTPNCSVCESNRGYYTDNVTKQCITKCGDTIVTPDEECDDGNLFNDDGCSSECQIELQSPKLVCYDYGCEEIPKPSIEIIQHSNSKSNDFFIKMDSQNNKPNCDSAIIHIESFEQKNYQYKVSTDSDGECNVQFQFLTSIYSYNRIHLIIPIITQSNRVLSDETREIIIVPKQVDYYSETQLEQSQQVVTTQENLGLSFQVLGPMTFLIGGFTFFFQILDVLTWLNNFYFLNVQYPENVNGFFKNLEWGTVLMIPNIFEMNLPTDNYYYQAPIKFAEKDVDPLYFNNMQLDAFILLIVLSLYPISVYFIRFVNSMYPQPIVSAQKVKKVIQPIQIDQGFVKITAPVKPIPLLLKYPYLKCVGYRRHFKAYLMQTFDLAFLDLCLATCLQLNDFSKIDYTTVLISTIVAWTSIFGIIGFLVISWIVSNKNTKLLKNKHYESIYGSLYEDFNINKPTAKVYGTLNLLRKALFIVSTVLLYHQPMFQTAVCCLTCFLNIGLILYDNPFKDYSTLIQNAIPDACVFIILFITVIIAIDDQVNMLTTDQKFNIGWVMLGFIALSILVQLIYLLIDLIGRFIYVVKIIITYVRTNCRKS